MKSWQYYWERLFIIFLLPFLFFVVPGCKHHEKTKSTPLSPQESLKHFQLEQGFDIKLVASEPLVQAPIAMDFDVKGRLWVVEMKGYMPDTAGTNENTNPNGKIVILEDKNKDGIMDSRKVFMDSLILPRAISFYKNGLLIAEPPRLWFVEIHHDTAGAKYIIDDHYAIGGNVEHQPNGLLRGIDNWIYSAKSDTRYRRINGIWQKEHTHFRGQWGITQDDYGRLFYNNNSFNLLGDYFLPGLGAENPDQRRVSGFDEDIVSDNRTYPIHPTPGVNRGYREGVLDSGQRLIHFTAACGPVIYRSPLFGKSYYGNAFVAAPAANLIKRDILYQKGFKVSGKQAYQGKEFLASDDERFRPVSLYNGPDGALYIVDMYRGIIQDITYLTPYLKNQIVTRHLQQPLNRGRIYKIVPQGKNPKTPVLSAKMPDELVELLDSRNPWVRKTTQRLLVDGAQTEVVLPLRQKMQSDTFLLGKIHAFWTLEGIGQLRKTDLEQFLHSQNIHLQRQAIAAIVSDMDSKNTGHWLREGFRLFKKKNPELAPYIGFLAADAMKYDPKGAEKLSLQLALQYPNNRFVVDAVISGLYQKESAFFQKVKEQGTDTTTVLYSHLTKVISNAKKRKEKQQKKEPEKFPKGKKLFTTYCEVCHGSDGAGIQSLGAPLNGSQWVLGAPEKLSAIVLYGLSGPVKVGNKIYRQPEVSGEMPGFAHNRKLSNEDIAHILSYIRNAWNNKAKPISQQEVEQARKKYKGRSKEFTTKELK